MTTNIGYITPSVELLGARISLLELVKNLDKSIFNPIVVCPRKGPLTDELYRSNIQYKVVRFGSWRKAKHWFYIPSAIFNLSELTHELHIDVWHSNEFWSFPYIYEAAKRNNIPTICHFRCSRKRDRLPPKKIKLYNVHKATKIILVSNSQKELFTSLNDTFSKIEVIPNGVDVEKFSNGSGEVFRNSIGISSNTILVGFIGLIAEHKGITTYLNSIKRLYKRYSNVKFIFIGPVHQKFRSYFMSSVETLPNKDDILVIGERQDIPNILKALDVLVVPSKEEAFGRVIIESMAAGTPIIASDVGGIREIISSEYNGLLVPSGNVKFLSESMLQLISDSNKRLKLSQNAYNFVNKHFSIRSHAQKIQDIYQKLLI